MIGNERDVLERSLRCTMRETRSAQALLIGTPLVADSINKGGQLGITVAILSVYRFAVFMVDNLKLASSRRNINKKHFYF